MRDEQIIEALTQIGADLRQCPAMTQRIMRLIAEKTIPARIAPSPRIIAPWVALLAAVAACLVVAGLLPWRSAFDPRAAFAAAINDIGRARTFSCLQISVHIGVDGKETTSYEESVMFKEPDLQRREWLTVNGAPTDETTITNYGNHRQLVIVEKDKTAALEDISSFYMVEPATGRLTPEVLNTSVRDDVVNLAAAAVEDLGITKLNGKDVRELRSSGPEPIKTVFVDPKTGLPVQIEQQWPSQSQRLTYASIQLDPGLDDSLFSLAIPPGHTLWHGRLIKPWSDSVGKMMTKMKYLALYCCEYAANHRGQFPDSLTDLTRAGITNANALATLLAAPEDPDGPPVMVYHKPRAGKAFGEEILIYEIPSHQRGGMVIAAMRDGHAETLTKEQFDNAMK